MALTAPAVVDTTEELNPFRIAMSQFDNAAQLLGLEPGLREVLRRPRRSLSLSLPVRMDSGKIHVFDGYRVQLRVVSRKVQIRTRSGLDWTSKLYVVFWPLKPVRTLRRLATS